MWNEKHESVQFLDAVLATPVAALMAEELEVFYQMNHAVAFIRKNSLYRL